MSGFQVDNSITSLSSAQLQHMTNKCGIPDGKCDGDYLFWNELSLAATGPIGAAHGGKLPVGAWLPISALNETEGKGSVKLGCGTGSGTTGPHAKPTLCPGNVAVGMNAGNMNQGIKWTDASTSGFVPSTCTGVSEFKYECIGHSVAIGHSAGKTNQFHNNVAIGYEAGLNHQGAYIDTILAGGESTAVGHHAGQTYQGAWATAVGSSAGKTYQGTDAVAVGTGAGACYQQKHASAFGCNAGRYYQGQFATAVGQESGYYKQQQYAVAIGYLAGYGYDKQDIPVCDGPSEWCKIVEWYNKLDKECGQGAQAIAIGHEAGKLCQGTGSIAIGTSAGQSGQCAHNIAIGEFAGYLSQGVFWNPKSQTGTPGWSAQFMGCTGVSAWTKMCHGESVAVGYKAGFNYQFGRSVAIGAFAGYSGQGILPYGDKNTKEYPGGEATAVGYYAGYQSQGWNSTAVGYIAGKMYQGLDAVAVGAQAAQCYQQRHGVAVGCMAAQFIQGQNSVAVGVQSGRWHQGQQAIAIGVGAARGKLIITSHECPSGPTNWCAVPEWWEQLPTDCGQKDNAIAIGREAGAMCQGTGAIAIGFNAGISGQHQKSIIINATGTPLNSTQADSCFVKPIRNNRGPSTLTYDPTTGEVTYDSSSSSTKDNIQDYTKNALDIIKQLPVKTYNYKQPSVRVIEPAEYEMEIIDNIASYVMVSPEVTEEYYEDFTGFLAEDVQEIDDTLVYTGLDDSAINIKWDALNSISLKAIQQLNEKIDALEEKVASLEVFHV